MPTDAELRSVRQAIYQAVVERGSAPSASDVARACGVPEPVAQAAFRDLAAAHVIILRPASLELWAAPPFSAAPTRFEVRADGRAFFAPCAWDAFGIPAALHADAVIETSCAWSHDALRCGVRDGRAFGAAVVHLLVPAAHFWDDVIYT